MDLSKLRQKVTQLDRKRGELLKRVLRTGEMIQGSLYQISRHCGNPNCKCAKGEKHVSWYLSRGFKGKTKLTYIGRIVPAWLDERVSRYQHHQRLLAQIRKIDSDISDSLNKIRDAKVQTIEEVLKERR